jgi:uncharacterized protein with HEPN domain
MHRAGSQVVELTADLTWEAFREDKRTQWAVLYLVSVIGEAAHHVPDTVKERAANVAWVRIRGMRNVIAHVYWDVDPEVIWTTARQAVPAMVDEVKRLLSEAESDEDHS